MSLKIISDTKFDFLQQKRKALMVSSFIIIISVFSFIIQGLNYGIDFSSGYIIQLEFDKDVKVDRIKKSFSNNSVENSVVQYYGSQKEVIIKLQESSSYDQNNINNFISEVLKNYKYKIQKLDFVGSQIGSELRTKGEWAMLVALISILVYIGFRFEFLYGIGAILALVHDVLITVGIFSILQLQFDLSVLSALLAVIGYSLNDTIVVYDRIRENANLMYSDKPENILNRSINQTLSRTLITSLTTLFVLFSLLIFGGIAVEYFAIAMIIGVLVGTFSSIYIAGASLYFLKVLESSGEN
mgnify:FL=1|tara:strand:- start:1135 stop:2031 length:897 start_codon:yes stop_codon:yes gene_type:complete